jgi:hypothetical protein
MVSGMCTGTDWKTGTIPAITVKISGAELK